MEQDGLPLAVEAEKCPQQHHGNDLVVSPLYRILAYIMAFLFSDPLSYKMSRRQLTFCARGIYQSIGSTEKYERRFRSSHGNKAKCRNFALDFSKKANNKPFHSIKFVDKFPLGGQRAMNHYPVF